MHTKLLQILADEFSRLAPVSCLWVCREPTSDDRPLPRQWRFEIPRNKRNNSLVELFSHGPDDSLFHFYLAARDNLALDDFIDLAAEAGRHFGDETAEVPAACIWLARLFESVETIIRSRQARYVTIPNAARESRRNLLALVSRDDDPAAGSLQKDLPDD